MNIPNLLTLLRIFFVPLLVAAMVQEDLLIRFGGITISNQLLGLGIFLFAAATDLLDGYLARRWGQVTTIGTLLDPIADKLLISAALISLVEVHAAPAAVVILIIGREFAVSGLRSIAAAEGYAIRASDLGKTKLISQVVAITLAMLSRTNPELQTAALVGLWCVVVFAMASAIEYFLKFWKQVDASVKARRRKELLRLEEERRLREGATRPGLNAERAR